MIVTDQVEVFLARKTQLPLERVSRIYRAGSPWPLVLNNIDHKVELYAQANGVSVDQACAVVEEWAKGEEARLMALVAEAQDAQGQPDFVEKLRALCSYPALREMLDHSQRVASQTGEETGTVLTLHFALNSFSMEHPDWDPEETGGRC